MSDVMHGAMKRRFRISLNDAIDSVLGVRVESGRWLGISSEPGAGLLEPEDNAPAAVIRQGK